MHVGDWCQPQPLLVHLVEVAMLATLKALPPIQGRHARRQHGQSSRYRTLPHSFGRRCTRIKINDDHNVLVRIRLPD